MRRIASINFAMASLLAACSPRPDPVTANRRLEPGDEVAVTILDERGQAILIESMRAAVRTSDPILPTAAPHGVRWSDVPNAVADAAGACDLAVVRREETPSGYRFTLVSNRDEPATLEVTRGNAPGDISATASVGSFAQRPEEAKRLVEEFDRFLRAYGRKPGFGSD